MTTGELFAAAPYHEPEDAADRVLGYLDFRALAHRRRRASYTCLVGTMVQEAYATHPAIRDACAREHPRSRRARSRPTSPRRSGRTAVVDVGRRRAASLARHTQAVLQGAFVVSKAANDPQVALDSIRHLRRYFEFLFRAPAPARRRS